MRDSLQLTSRTSKLQTLLFFAFCSLLGGKVVPTPTPIFTLRISVWKGVEERMHALTETPTLAQTLVLTQTPTLAQTLVSLSTKISIAVSAFANAIPNPHPNTNSNCKP